jgi:DNA-directed RNA polymerase subunit H (RpoH/RPB5)
MPFACTICDQESTQICHFCTKDTCGDHLCERCLLCSDCCECDVPLDEHPLVEQAPIVASEDSGELLAEIDSSETEQPAIEPAEPVTEEVEKVAEAAAGESPPAPEV